MTVFINTPSAVASGDGDDTLITNSFEGTLGFESEEH
jgi:hypothetical protein